MLVATLIFISMTMFRMSSYQNPKTAYASDRARYVYASIAYSVTMLFVCDIIVAAIYVQCAMGYGLINIITEVYYLLTVFIIHANFMLIFFNYEYILFQRLYILNCIIFSHYLTALLVDGSIFQHPLWVIMILCNMYLKIGIHPIHNIKSCF